MTVILKIFSAFFAITLTTEYELFNDANSICCDGTVIPKPKRDGYDYFCCKKNIYNYSISDTSSYNYYCCGEALVDYKKIYCFNNSIQVPLPEGDNTEMCGNSAAELKPYDSFDKICCNGIIHANSDYTKACCGSTNLIDTTTHICCMDYEYDEKLNTYVNLYEAVPYGDVESSKAQCCKVKNQFIVYDNTKQECFYNELYEAKKEHERRCCDKNFKYKSGIWSVSDTQTDGAPNDEACMYSDAPITVFLANRSSIVCYKNELRILEENVLPCGSCDNKLYYKPASQACCGNVVVNLSHEHIAIRNMSCCY